LDEENPIPSLADHCTFDDSTATDEGENNNNNNNNTNNIADEETDTSGGDDDEDDDDEEEENSFNQEYRQSRGCTKNNAALQDLLSKVKDLPTDQAKQLLGQALQTLQDQGNAALHRASMTTAASTTSTTTTAPPPSRFSQFLGISSCTWLTTIPTLDEGDGEADGSHDDDDDNNTDWDDDDDDETTRLMHDDDADVAATRRRCRRRPAARLPSCTPTLKIKAKFATTQLTRTAVVTPTASTPTVYMDGSINSMVSGQSGCSTMDHTTVDPRYEEEEDDDDEDGTSTILTSTLTPVQQNVTVVPAAPLSLPVWQRRRLPLSQQEQQQQQQQPSDEQSLLQPSDEGQPLELERTVSMIWRERLKTLKCIYNPKHGRRLALKEQKQQQQRAEEQQQQGQQQQEQQQHEHQQHEHQQQDDAPNKSDKLHLGEQPRREDSPDGRPQQDPSPSSYKCLGDETEDLPNDKLDRPPALSSSPRGKRKIKLRAKKIQLLLCFCQKQGLHHVEEEEKNASGTLASAKQLEKDEPTTNVTTRSGDTAFLSTTTPCQGVKFSIRHGRPKVDPAAIIMPLQGTTLSTSSVRRSKKHEDELEQAQAKLHQSDLLCSVAISSNSSASSSSVGHHRDPRHPYRGTNHHRGLLNPNGEHDDDDPEAEGVELVIFDRTPSFLEEDDDGSEEQSNKETSSPPSISNRHNETKDMAMPIPTKPVTSTERVSPTTTAIHVSHREDGVQRSTQRTRHEPDVQEVQQDDVVASVGSSAPHLPQQQQQWLSKIRISVGRAGGSNETGEQQTLTEEENSVAHNHSTAASSESTSVGSNQSQSPASMAGASHGAMVSSPTMRLSSPLPRTDPNIGMSETSATCSTTDRLAPPSELPQSRRISYQATTAKRTEKAQDDIRLTKYKEMYGDPSKTESPHNRPGQRLEQHSNEATTPLPFSTKISIIQPSGSMTEHSRGFKRMDAAGRIQQERSPLLEELQDTANHSQTGNSAEEYSSPAFVKEATPTQPLSRKNSNPDYGSDYSSSDLLARQDDKHCRRNKRDEADSNDPRSLPEHSESAVFQTEHNKVKQRTRSMRPSQKEPPQKLLVRDYRDKVTRLRERSRVAREKIRSVSFATIPDSETAPVMVSRPPPFTLDDNGSLFYEYESKSVGDEDFNFSSAASSNFFVAAEGSPPHPALSIVAASPPSSYSNYRRTVSTSIEPPSQSLPSLARGLAMDKEDDRFYNVEKIDFAASRWLEKRQPTVRSTGSGSSSDPFDISFDSSANSKSQGANKFDSPRGVADDATALWAGVDSSF
jgi:hypothetical protein